jgi:MazG family protein
MEAFDRLIGIMERLRDPESGCPWDVEQDFDSIAPCTIEEAYEVAEAIRVRDFAGLCEELGDLLLQVVFHAQMASEAGRFGIGRVVEGLCDKLVRRHPHVFGDAVVETAAAQLRAWDEHKAAERRARGEEPGPLAGVAIALPALVRAEKLQRRAARAGLAARDAASLAAELRERLGRLQTASAAAPPAAEMGALLFAAAGLARELGVDAEAALREANARFEATADAASR